MSTKVFLLLLTLQIPVDALFSTGFTKFLETNYGLKIANQLGRADLSPTASYGGGNESDHMALKLVCLQLWLKFVILRFLSHDPVILVHGVKSYANSLISVRDFFENNGFEKGSVFATRSF